MKRSEHGLSFICCTKFPCPTPHLRSSVFLCLCASSKELERPILKPPSALKSLPGRDLADVEKIPCLVAVLSLAKDQWYIVYFVLFSSSGTGITGIILPTAKEHIGRNVSRKVPDKDLK